MRIITPQTLADLTRIAEDTPRRRRNLNLHAEAADPTQRMLNAGHPGSYVRPHRHGPRRWESFVLLRGAIAILLFDARGRLTDRTELRAGGPLLAELPGATWHSIVFLEPGSTVYEVKPGPYLPAEDKDFADWAPAEGEAGAADLESWMARAQPGECWNRRPDGDHPAEPSPAE